ncbi:MAG: DNA polymerase IV [Hyphomonadaceae bacterium]
MNASLPCNDREIPSLCRDCLNGFTTAATIAVKRNDGTLCPQCGSPRIVSHPRLLDLSVAHIDCDAFYAAIEKRDNPALAARPVIVGGGKRGVVSTCCYIARTFGVRSAMPMFKALKACPDAVVIKPRMDVYAREGRVIRDMMKELTPLVEPVSIDEAYLDLAGTEALHGARPATMLMKLQKRVEAELQLTISVGLASNKFLAKTASEADKPRGFFVLSLDEAPAYLAPRSVRVIGGVGPAMAARLERAGVRTVGDIQSRGDREMRRLFGDTGHWLNELAFGRHNRKVTPDGDRRSVSSETTFIEDISDAQTLENILWKLCQRTADRAKEAGVEGRVVTLKLKTAAFQTVTRRVSLRESTQLANVLFRTAKELLRKEATGAKYRLIGVGLSDLSNAHADAADLADPLALKRARAERASDTARKRFGSDAVMTGRGVRPRRDDDSGNGKKGS